MECLQQLFGQIALCDVASVTYSHNVSKNKFLCETGGSRGARDSKALPQCASALPFSSIMTALYLRSFLTAM